MAGWVFPVDNRERTPNIPPIYIIYLRQEEVRKEEYRDSKEKRGGIIARRVGQHGLLTVYLDKK